MAYLQDIDSKNYKFDDYYDEIEVESKKDKMYLWNKNTKSK